MLPTQLFLDSGMNEMVVCKRLQLSDFIIDFGFEKLSEIMAVDKQGVRRKKV